MLIWPLNSLYNALTDFVSAKLQPITTVLGVIREKQEAIMADITKIQEDEAAELTAIDALKQAVIANVAQTKTNADLIMAQSQQIQALKDQIASGSPVTPEQLTALDAQIVINAKQIQDQATALTAALAPAVPGDPSTPETPATTETPAT